MKNLPLLIIFLFSFSIAAKDCELGSPLKIFHPKYATHFSIYYYKNFKVIHTDDDSYFLAEKAISNCETKMQRITTPVEKVVMMSTTYLPALLLIKKEKTLQGFQGKNYIVSSGFQLNKVQDVAYKFNPEYLRGLNSDLIMGYDSNLSSLSQRQLFKKLKIPVVLNRDFKEKTPLARAEWLIFIASFYNQDEPAKEIFNSIEKKYLTIKEKNLKENKKVKVLVGDIQNGKWISCEPGSDLIRLIEDAGGIIRSQKTQSISLEELSQDKVVYDVWLTNNMWASKKELEDASKKDNRYSLINAKNIFNNNLVINANKSNDYWETGMQRPDLLLLDLSAAFYPQNYQDYKMHWYRKL